MSFLGTTVKSRGQEDLLVVKDVKHVSAGDPWKIGDPLTIGDHWIHTAGGKNVERPGVIATDSTGACYLAGQFSSRVVVGGASLKVKGKEDLLLYKLDAIGNVKWTYSAGGSGVKLHVAGVSASATHVDVVGSTMSQASTTLSIGSSSIPVSAEETGFVARFDSSGKPLWATSTGTALPAGVALGPGGASLITGSYQGVVVLGPAVLTSRGCSDILVARLDTTGAIRAAASAGGRLCDEGSALAVASTGEIYVTGFFDEKAGGKAAFGGKTLTCQGDSDIFVWKLK